MMRRHFLRVGKTRNNKTNWEQSGLVGICEREFSPTAAGNVVWFKYCRTHCGDFSENKGLPSPSATALLGLYPQDTKQSKGHLPFMAAPSTTANVGNQPRCPRDEWIMKTQYKNAMKYYVAAGLIKSCNFLLFGWNWRISCYMESERGQITYYFSYQWYTE